MRKFAVLLAVSILLIGCTPLERQAYDIVVGAKAFIDAEKRMHPECVNATGMAFCGKIAQATDAKDALITAAEIYCSGPSFEAGGKCEAPAKGTNAYVQAEAKLKAAMANYKQFELELKGAAGK